MGGEEEGRDESHEGGEEEGGDEGHESGEEEGRDEGHEGSEEEGCDEGHEGGKEVSAAWYWTRSEKPAQAWHQLQVWGCPHWLSVGAAFLLLHATSVVAGAAGNR